MYHGNEGKDLNQNDYNNISWYPRKIHGNKYSGSDSDIVHILYFN